MLKMKHLPYLTWTEVTESDSGLEPNLNNNDIKKASWSNNIISLDRQYKPRNYLEYVSFTFLNMNNGKWKWFRLETILNNNDIKKASSFNHIISFDRQYKDRNYL